MYTYIYIHATYLYMYSCVYTHMYARTQLNTT